MRAASSVGKLPLVLIALRSWRLSAWIAFVYPGRCAPDGLQTNYGFEIGTRTGNYGPVTGLGSIGGATTEEVHVTLGELERGSDHVLLPRHRDQRRRHRPGQIGRSQPPPTTTRSCSRSRYRS